MRESGGFECLLGRMALNAYLIVVALNVYGFECLSKCGGSEHLSKKG